MRGIFIVVMGAAAIGGPAGAAVCVDPGWRVRPTQSQLFGVWPRDAFQKGVNGNAVIACKVSVQGALHDRTVLSESPANQGFGKAALALTPQFLMTPLTCDGTPKEGEVEIPLRFTGLTPTHSGSRAPETRTRIPYPPGPPTSDLVLSEVPWTAAPTYAQVVAAYPVKAGAANVGGHVALKCLLGAEGRLGDCDVISESPRGQDFGGAAKALAKDFVGPVKGADGTTTQDETTMIAFTFDPAMLSGKTSVIGKPQWTRVPEAVDVSAAFPAAARAAHVSTGHVTLGCDVGDGGHLTGCAVTRQSPAGLDFDKAALALSAIFQVTVWTDEGLPTVGGRVEVPIRYEADPATGSAKP